MIANLSRSFGRDRDGNVAATFALSLVPATFLIDPQGRVAAKDLRGPAIEAAVAKAVADTGKDRSAKGN